MLEPIDEYYKNIRKCTTEDGISSDVSVAVMTVCGTVGTKINLLNFFDHYIEGNCGEFELSFTPNTKESRAQSRNTFYNCLNVLFYYTDPNKITSKISAKIFPNGSIHLPGCRTIEAVHNVPKILYNFIEDIDEISETTIIEDHDLFELTDLRIVLINSNFLFNREILQERIKNTINEARYEGKPTPGKIWRFATFQPEKYAGVNIRYWTRATREKYASYYISHKKIPKKIDGQVSIFIFRSGKGTITGAKNTKDLLEAYLAISDLVRKEPVTI
jgi:TATA-box binding protein (TBP) (component of TFIID and TFIIIB)